MKGSCTLVASVLAASTVALSSSSSSASGSGDRDVAFYPCSNQGGAMAKKEAGNTSKTSEEGRFAPRFDGLRFIETLITAHR